MSGTVTPMPQEQASTSTPQAIPPDPGSELVTLDNVLFVSDGLAPICEYRGQRFGLPFKLMEPGTSIRAPGDRGTLFVTRSVAQYLRLL